MFNSDKASKAAPILLSKDADTNKAAIYRDEDGHAIVTPLYQAAMHGRTEVARSLLESKANPNKGYRKTDKDGNVTVETPLFMAALRGYTEIVRSLLESGARKDLLVGGGGELGRSPLSLLL